jgi:hypothetical protein
VGGYGQVSISLVGLTLVLRGALLVDDFHHLSLDGFFFEHQSVLVPDEVGVLRVDALLLHASFEQTDDVAVVGVLCEAEATAVVHEFSEFFRLVLTQVIDRCLLLLLLDSRVLLGLGSTGQTLPWQRAF